MNNQLLDSNSDSVRRMVREGYARIAESGSCCGPSGGCCGPSTVSSEDLARHIGYSGDELAGLPGGGKLGLSCGQPNAVASLPPGETVLDLRRCGGFRRFHAR